MKLFIVILALFPLLTGFAPFKGPTDLGNEAYQKGDYGEALKQYLQAEAGRPDSAEAHYNLGNVYYRLGRYDKADEEYREAARLDPGMADAYYNSGNSLFRQKEYEGALKAYGKAEGTYGRTDKDTEHNIEIVKKLIEKKKEEEKNQQQKSGQKGQQSKSGQQKQQQGGSGGRQSPQAGQSGQQAQRQAGPPAMSNEELKALLDRQAREEKSLRNYFRPGEKPNANDRESEIEQMLRGMGMGPMEREMKPGQPYVERDW